MHFRKARRYLKRKSMLTQPRQQAIPSLMRVIGEGKRDDCSTRRGNLTKMIDVSLSSFFARIIGTFPALSPNYQDLARLLLKKLNLEKSLMQIYLIGRLPSHTVIKIFFLFLTGITENDSFCVCKCNLTLWYSMTTKAMVKKQFKSLRHI